MERERGEREKEEAAIAASMQNSKKKLLNDLAQESAQQEAAVRELQDIKDKEKGNLISCLSNGEYLCIYLFSIHTIHTYLEIIIHFRKEIGEPELPTSFQNLLVNKD